MMARVVALFLVLASCQAFLAPMPRSAAVATSSRRMVMSAAPPAFRGDFAEQSTATKVKTITGELEFLEAMASNGDKPVVLKFYDTFCRACKAVAPKFERMAQENPGVAFYQVEFRQDKALCKSLGITMLPTIQIYQGAEGKIVDLPVGPKRFSAAESALAKVLEKRISEHGTTGSIHIPSN